MLYGLAVVYFHFCKGYAMINAWLNTGDVIETDAQSPDVMRFNALTDTGGITVQIRNNGMFTVWVTDAENQIVDRIASGYVDEY